MTTKGNAKPTLAEINAVTTLFNQGRFAEAETGAIKMTQAYPKHDFGWKALGAIQKNQGRLVEAVAAFKVAVTLAPKDSEAHHNLGNCYFDQGDFSKAESSYLKAVKLAPNFALAQYNLACALKCQDQLASAEDHYKKAIKIEPKNALFHTSLAETYYQQKRFDLAIDAYQQAIVLNPDDAVLYVSLGACFKSLMRYSDAERAYKKALELNPNYALVYSNLGDMLNELGHFDDAVIQCKHAIEIDSTFAKAYSNLGMALQNLASFDVAAIAFEKALELDPQDTATLSNYSLLLVAQNKFMQAEVYQKQVIDLNPNFVAVYINLGLNYIHQGRISEAEACYLKALSLQPDSILAKSGLLFSLNYSAEHSVEQCLIQAQEYNRMVAAKVKGAFTSWLNTNPSPRLRVGLVSGDLRQHAVSYFLDNVLRYFDAEKLELIAYTTDAREDAMTARLRPCFSAWHSLVGLGDKDAAHMIHQHGIQVLIDLSGHTAGNRLPIFAWKPAPVQVSWLGYFATTGLDAMDYFIADSVGVPANNCAQFVEKVKYLPDTRLCFSAPDIPVAVSLLPSLGNGYITFGCFQNMAKIGDDVLTLWAKVLNAVPHAKLRLQNKALGSDEVIATTLKRLEKCGINPDNVVMHGFISREGYLHAHAEIDMILDTFPFNGGTTTCEALWMGVPTLTIAGDTLIARQGASLLTAAGLDDWVVNNEADFVSRAIAFAADKKHLAQLRAQLRAQVLSSPLFDGRLFARNMERALIEMWQEKGVAMTSRDGVHTEVQHQLLKKEPLQQQVHVVSATRYSESDFWRQSALGISLNKQLGFDVRLSASIAFENSAGLSDVFNKNIMQAGDDAILVFIHDDVWIDEENFADAVICGLEHFDVIGVAGNKRRVPKQPAWPFVDMKFTWDDRANLSGRVAHGQSAFGTVSDFGDVPAECELMDGVFLATKKSSLIKSGVMFDPQFDFHFYDLDFCRSARAAGLRLGTWLIQLTHQSGGAFGSQRWLEKYQLYLDKWESALDKDAELQAAMNDVLQLAIEHQQAGHIEQAELLYQEILKVQPGHAEASHNLGVIEANTKGAANALPRLEQAVQLQPENEQYWITYIDALMQSGATESAVDAIALAQSYGLKAETAQLLTAEFTEKIKSNQGASQDNASDFDIHIYQIYYSEQTQRENDVGFIPLDNLANQRPDWREYWPIRNYLLQNQLNEDDYYGFFSPKFKSKTNLDAEAVHQFIRKNAAQTDVFLFSPFFDQGTYFLNIFEQGSLAHEGIADAFQQTIEMVAPEVDLITLVMNSKNTVYCNYIVAKPSFWRVWLEVCEQIFAIAEENNSSFATNLNAGTNHDNGIAPNKVFVIERIASLLFCTRHDWRISAYDSTLLPYGNPTFYQYTRELLQLDQLKLAADFHENVALINKFMEIRHVMELSWKANKFIKLGYMEHAAKAFQEIINIQPRHAEANHYLGVFETNQNGALAALPMLEIAVEEVPENEQYWVSYIDALVQAGAMETAVSALELGQKYGLKSVTAQQLAAEFVEKMENNLVNTDLFNSKIAHQTSPELGVLKIYCVSHKLPLLPERLYDFVIGLGDYIPSCGQNISEIDSFWDMNRPLAYGAAGNYVIPLVMTMNNDRTDVTGISSYRKIVVRSAVGREADNYPDLRMVSAEDILHLSEDETRPRPGFSFLIPMPVHYSIGVIAQYNSAHHIVDMLEYLAIAIELGVIEPLDVNEFVAENTLIPGGCEMGVYPTEWLSSTLSKLERVGREFILRYGERVRQYDKYQVRAVGFLSERLGSLLLRKELTRLYPAGVPNEIFGYMCNIQEGSTYIGTSV